jgi:trimeric autotransporter adhesin
MVSAFFAKRRSYKTMAQRKFIIDGGFTTNADSSLTGNLDMTGHIIPTVDSNGTTGYDLGSPDFKWRDLYLSQGSLYIDGQKVIESNSGTIVVQADAGQSLTTKVSGAGVMTLESATTVNMAATVQMQTGKKITDQGGNAVVFGDKVDMDNNQIINVGVPTANEHAATKAYVDSLVGGISESAITAGDSEVAIADLGTGTVGITVDGVQKLALSAAAAAFTVPVTVNGATLANEAYADQAEADAIASAETYTDSRETAITTAYEAADTALTLAVQSEASRIDAIMSASTSDADTFAEIVTMINSVDTVNDGLLGTEISNRVSSDSALQVNIDSANTLRASGDAALDLRLDVIEGTGVGSVNKTANDASADATAKADAAEASAIASAEAKDVVRASAASADATSKANAAQSAAEATASADATSKANAAQAAAIAAASTDASTKADTAETDAIASAEAKDVVRATAAATDATNKADAALVAAEAKDVVRATAAAFDATTKADAAQSAAEATASADATAKANAAQAAAIAAAETKADTAEDNAIQTASTDATSKADAARVAAIAAAALDATSKANAAETNAIAHADAEIAGLIDAAPGALDTLNELAAAMGDDANFAATVSNNLAAESTARVNGDAATLVSAKAYTDTEVATEATARSNADTALDGRLDVIEGANTVVGSVAKAQADAISTAASDATTKADAAEADAIASAEAKDVVRAATASADATSKADAAETNAIASAETYTDGRETAITTAYQSYADTAEADAIASAEAKDVVRASAASADATAKANSAEADAIASAEAKDVVRASAASADATSKANAALSSANSYTDGRENAITTAYQSYANTAEADAIATAATDATNKANAAQAAAISQSQSYADTGIGQLEASLTHFHSSLVDVTSAVSATNSSSSVTFTFSELSNARHYVVLLNRLILRPSEYSVSGTTLTIQTGVLSTDDELEVTGFSS